MEMMTHWSFQILEGWVKKDWLGCKLQRSVTCLPLHSQCPVPSALGGSGNVCGVNICIHVIGSQALWSEHAASFVLASLHF